MMSFGPEYEQRKRRDSGERRRISDRAIFRAGKIAAAILAISSLTVAILSATGWTRFDARAEIAHHERRMQIASREADSAMAALYVRVQIVEDAQAKLNRRQLLMNYLQCTREISRDITVRNLCTEVIRDWLNQ